MIRLLFFFVLVTGLLVQGPLTCHGIGTMRSKVAKRQLQMQGQFLKENVDASKYTEKNEAEPASSKWVKDLEGDEVVYDFQPIKIENLPDSLASLKNPKSALFSTLAGINEVKGWKYGLNAEGKVSVTLLYAKNKPALPKDVPKEIAFNFKEIGAYENDAEIAVGEAVELLKEKQGKMWVMEKSTVGACLRRQRRGIWNINDHILTTFHGVGTDAGRSVYYNFDKCGKIADFKYHDDADEAEEGDWALVKLNFWYTCTRRGAKNGAKKWNTLEDFVGHVRDKVKSDAKPKISYNGIYNQENVALNPETLVTTLRLRGYAVAGYLNLDNARHRKGDSGSGCYYTDGDDATPYLVGILKGGSQYDAQCTPIWIIQQFLPNYLEVV